MENIVNQVARLWKRRVHRIVTSWTTGVQVSIDVTDLDYTNFLTEVGESFDFENPRVYALQNSVYRRHYFQRYSFCRKT